MKKRLLIRASAFALIALIMATFLPSANAHSGRTDGQGGHTDHSTGEYHFHHGYPAHDHYDMDGDGDLDCPYDFDDQTGKNSGTSTNKATTSATVAEPITNNEPSDSGENSFKPVWIAILAFALYIFLMYILPFLIS